MATILNNEEENQQTATSQVSSTVAPMTGQQSAVAAPARQGSSNRPNINKYLQANQGAGQQLAQGIQEKVQNQAQNLNKSIQSSNEQMQSKINPLEQELGDQGQQKIQTAFQDPKQILQNQQQLEQFKRLRDMGATQDIQTFAQQGDQAINTLQGQQNKIQEQAQMATTEGGRFGLLRNTFGQPTYSRGQQRLDQLFLQAQPGAARGLQHNLRDLNKATGQSVDQFGSQLANKQQAVTNLMQQRAQDVKDIFGQGMTDIGAAINQRKALAPEQIAAATSLDERLAKNELTAEDVALLGLNAGQKIYNVDLANFLLPEQRDIGSIGNAEFANPEEFARYNALMELSAAQVPSIFGGATEAGGFNPYRYDQSDLTSALTAAENRVNELSQSYQPTTTDLYNIMKNLGSYDAATEPQMLLLDAYNKNPTAENLQKLVDYKFDDPGTIWHNQNMLNSWAKDDYRVPLGVRQQLMNLINTAPEYFNYNPDNILMTPELKQQLAQTAKSISPVTGSVNPETYPIKKV